MEQQIPNWLDDAVLAAGLCTIYNEDHWDHLAAIPRPILERSGIDPLPPLLN